MNTSQHDPVGIDLTIELDIIARDTNTPTVQPRVNWDKINKPRYQKLATTMLEDYKMDRGKLSACEISNMTSHLCAIIDTAARVCSKATVNKPNGQKEQKGYLAHSCK